MVGGSTVKPGDLVQIDTGRGDYDGCFGLIISKFDHYYYKVFVSNAGFNFYMENHVKVLQ